MNAGILDQYGKATVWYHPMTDRLFIFHRATFFMFPCLEREDGKKLVLNSPLEFKKTFDIPDEIPDLEYVGEL